MKKISIKLVVAIVAMCTAGFMMPSVFADTQSTMTVSPMTQKMILAPGETVTGSVSVSNPADAVSDLEYSVHVGSFSQKKDEGGLDDYGAVDTEVVSSYNTMMQWITLNKEEGVVAPNGTDAISFTINVPEDAPAGGQYATILVRNETKEKDGENGNVSIQSVTQIASIIYAEVTGETKEDGEVLKNDLPGFVFSNPFTATSMVRNDGNMHTNAKYVLQVWPLFSDEEICTNEEEPAESLVMPETERYHSESCDLPLIGIFRAKQTVTIFGETVVSERTVIKCPIWLLFIAVFAVIAVIIWLVMRAKTREFDAE
ncbi:hypothetical protein J6X73_03285 [Candidatus Saccharibacteria bacterium]|nr:hypothetical protein [Candidatus Saccharibacteria bacterium]